jgi:hypothetical protein
MQREKRAPPKKGRPNDHRYVFPRRKPEVIRRR